MGEDTIKIRLSAIRIISSYLDELINDNYTDDSASVAAKIYACKELIFLIKHFNDPPLEIIEGFGRKMKAYSYDRPMFSEAVVACEVICELLGG